MTGPVQPQSRFQAPTGTRDFYPAEVVRSRYVSEAWRRVSIRHGFDEVDGPTFEHLDLYTVKSGEAIVSELFSFQRAGGEKTYALRPEFTPTLARMYAARAGALARPTKWFWTGACFRAERPQRGRLREFLQWNCDVLGDESPRADAEVIACAVALLEELGVSPRQARVRISHRGAVEAMLGSRGVRPEGMPAWFALLDRVGKMSNDDFVDAAAALGVPAQQAVGVLALMARSTSFEEPTTQMMLSEEVGGRGPEYFRALFEELRAAGVAEWCTLNLGIVRGLAYYTGMVFEIHEASGKERAIAGGGRYDTLIELFGGPPTPAVGFGMGDVVLSLVLGENGLIPGEADLARRLGLRVDAFVCSSGSEEAEGQVAAVAAMLRREGLHVRRSYKASKNIGKLLREAAAVGPGGAGARFAVIIESGEAASIKNLDTGEQRPGTVPLTALGALLRG